MAKPLLFITGFLGAGKTTLLRALLEELNRLGRSADVILNDFENAEIDASTLKERAASIHPIAASCACCDSLDDLVQLCLAAQRSTGDVLLIELNGTADPLPLLEAFTLLEDQLSFTPRWQVSVVDARHWGLRNEFAPLEERQMETATHWVLTHAETLSDVAIEATVESVGLINSHATRVNASQLAARLGHHGLASENARARTHGREAESGKIGRRGHRLSHRLTGYQIPLPGRYGRYQMMELLEALPDEVVRAKALVELKGSTGSRWLFQRTGRHPVEPPLEVDGLTRAPASLVCIGPHLDPEGLQALATHHLDGHPVRM